MPRYVALIRTVNVGGTGKLPMSELKSICEDAGFLNVQTYIASGNVVFESKASESKVKSELEARLRDYLGDPAGVILRTTAEMQAVLKANPFKKEEPKYTLVIFLDAPPERRARPCNWHRR